MVPSTPKLSAGSGSETVTSQVPTFMFQSATNPEAIGGTSVSGASGKVSRLYFEFHIFLSLERFVEKLGSFF